MAEVNNNLLLRVDDQAITSGTLSLWIGMDTVVQRDNIRLTEISGLPFNSPKWLKWRMKKENIALLLTAIGIIVAALALLSRGTLCSWGKNILQTDIFCEPIPSTPTPTHPPPTPIQALPQSCETTISDGNIQTVWKINRGDWAIADDSGNDVFKVLEGIGEIECGNETWIDYVISLNVKLTQASETARALLNFRNSADSRLITTIDFSQKNIQIYEKESLEIFTDTLGPPVVNEFVVNIWYGIKVEIIGNRVTVYIDNERRRSVIFASTIDRGSILLKSYDPNLLFDDLQVNVTLKQQ